MYRRGGIFGLFRSIRTLITCGVFLCCMGGIAAFVLYEYVGYKQQQAAMIAAYGQNVIDMCKSPSKPSGSSASTSGITNKIVVLNSDGVTVGRIFDTVPDDQKAKDKTDLTGVVCVAETSTVFGTPSTYGNGKYTCTQYQYVDDVYVIDAKSGQTVSYKQFAGSNPPDCPDSVSDNTSQYGNSPDGATIKDWILSTNQ